MHRLLLIVVLLPLAGWGGCSAPVKPQIPEKVYVRVEVPAQLPKSLTAGCPPVHAQQRSIEAVVSAYNTNIPSQTDCDQRMGEIRRLTAPAQEQSKP
ncbi:hypothetical protein ACP93_02600 [Xanthomonas sp. NCPPB 1128]|uniref:hypothetical protein n=1 Tax=Xanthomonas sp. NCPPB 1128 TaxID=1775876 RepID=UPI00065ACE63|nr:hypothetical protein [Xanthomonas sp. NCPPB 1128]KMM77072.1 hypothetical protein ACP93_02335 [Xanthomonas sp. NCPPB 1128]KMM77116.1 hypothetical protein ACP93_02600 [Xanthomonas sp. NCPPB 1128]